MPSVAKAEAFATDLLSIERWIGPSNFIGNWRTGHANMRGYATTLLVGQASKVEREQRKLKSAADEKLKLVHLVDSGKKLNELHAMLSVFNRYGLASLDPDEYLAEARKRLGPEKEPAHSAAEAAPSDEGLAALAPVADELPRE